MKFLCVVCVWVYLCGLQKGLRVCTWPTALLKLRRWLVEKEEKKEKKKKREQLLDSGEKGKGEKCVLTGT